MRQTEAARTSTRRTLGPSVGLVVTLAMIGALAYQSASSSASSFTQPPSRGAPAAVPKSASLSAPSFREGSPDDHRGARIEARGAVTEADGALPAGVTVFDSRYPGVANLDPDVLRAMRAATADAADGGIELYVNSGWRSPEYQDRLFREAVLTYGSEEEAARWVATADTSAHVSGDAVDIGPLAARAWLSQHGAKYGLCQIYSNEPWHYELRPNAVERGCPPMYADSARAPTVQP